jgi:hypothetical protein
MAEGAILMCDGKVTTSGVAATWHSDGLGGFVIDVYVDGGVGEIDCLPLIP